MPPPDSPPALASDTNPEAHQNDTSSHVAKSVDPKFPPLSVGSTSDNRPGDPTSQTSSNIVDPSSKVPGRRDSDPALSTRHIDELSRAIALDRKASAPTRKIIPVPYIAPQNDSGDNQEEDLFVSEQVVPPQATKPTAAKHAQFVAASPKASAPFQKLHKAKVPLKHKAPPPTGKEPGFRRHRLHTMHKVGIGKQLQLPDEQNEQEKEDVYQQIEGAQRVEDVGGSGMLSADNFPTLIAHFKMGSVYARFTPSRIDRNKSIVFDAVSLKRSDSSSEMEAVWRRVSMEADSVTSNVRLFDVDKKVFLGTRLNLDKAPSIKPDGIRHFKGLTLGKGRPTIDQWEHFISLWLEGREIPITILSKTSQDIQDIGRVLALVQAYKLRCREEAEWAQHAHELIQSELSEYAQTPNVEAKDEDDFDTKLEV
eukprot:Gregarina_sp_Poly_1__9800@NODE_626_length_7076_cov_188_008560_g480_i0_p2_GENE_NODE_626_length_7076_cov_188_008560_g480_i0NODE_626_length_7076_cov_188_008560_g480_i0_p2_ORF_typecomplete_len424_score57_34bPH_1/PF08000_11/0_18_NODE_626_length_7076_cov_188_008560_g480_i037044975